MRLDERITEVVLTGHVTLADIRQWVARARDQTTFFPRTNQTYYPAYWTMGDGAGDASTSDCYETGLQRAAEHVAYELGLDMAEKFRDLTRGRDAAQIIADALREQRAQDAEQDKHLNEPIAVG